MFKKKLSNANIMFPFFQCSATCGSGTRKRIVKCYEIKGGLKSRDCPIESKPHHYEKCNTKACPTKMTGKFSKHTYLDHRSPGEITQFDLSAVVSMLHDKLFSTLKLFTFLNVILFFFFFFF